MHARVVMLAAWSALATSVAGAQQPVALRIEPPVGETVRMRLDQRVEMSGTTRVGAGDSTATVVSTLLVISRTVVERQVRDVVRPLQLLEHVVSADLPALINRVKQFSFKPQDAHGFF